MSHEKETKQTPAAETKAPETEAKAPEQEAPRPRSPRQSTRVSTTTRQRPCRLSWTRRRKRTRN